jgi:hypothetical protein
MRAAKLGAPRQSAALGGKQAARDAEHWFPVRIRIAVPPEGLGSRLDQIIAWLDVEEQRHPASRSTLRNFQADADD